MLFHKVSKWSAFVLYTAFRNAMSIRSSRSLLSLNIAERKISCSFLANVLKAVKKTSAAAPFVPAGQADQDWPVKDMINTGSAPLLSWSFCI